MSLPTPTTALRLLSRWTPGRMLFSLPPHGSGRVAVTFDDGPHPEFTPRVLDALASAGVRATFFFQGTAAQSSPQLVRRACVEGHCIAAHGMTHTSARCQSAAQALANAADCHALLEQTVQAPLPRLYRPPYGELNLGSLLALWRGGFELAFWNYDSNDSVVTTAEEVLQRVTRSPPTSGSILLFHDDYRITAAALPDILSGLQRRGLDLVRIGDISA